MELSQRLTNVANALSSENGNFIIKACQDEIQRIADILKQEEQESETVSYKLTQAMKRLGFTATAQLADYTGVPSTTLGRYLRGETEPRGENLTKLKETLEIEFKAVL